jgi:hypothetical protein
MNKPIIKPVLISIIASFLLLGVAPAASAFPSRTPITSLFPPACPVCSPILRHVCPYVACIIAD